MGKKKKQKAIYIKANRNYLAVNWESTGIGGDSSELNLSCAASDEAGEHHAATVFPFGEFLREDVLRALTGIQPLDERRAFGGTRADVEGPGDKSTIFVLVEGDLIASHVGDGGFETL